MMKKIVAPIFISLLLLLALFTFAQAQGEMKFCRVKGDFPGKCPTQELGCFEEMSANYGASSILHGCQCILHGSSHSCSCLALCQPPA